MTSDESPFDTTVAHQARVYDYLLGGKDNYAADRAAADAWLKVNPDLAPSAHANRAVRYPPADKPAAVHAPQPGSGRPFL